VQRCGSKNQGRVVGSRRNDKWLPTAPDGRRYWRTIRVRACDRVQGDVPPAQKHFRQGSLARLAGGLGHGPRRADVAAVGRLTARPIKNRHHSGHGGSAHRGEARAGDRPKRAAGRFIQIFQTGLFANEDLADWVVHGDQLGPSGKVASTCTSWIISAMPYSIQSSRVMIGNRPAQFLGHAAAIACAFRTDGIGDQAIRLSGCVQLNAVGPSACGATFAAMAISSLSFHGGVSCNVKSIQVFGEGRAMAAGGGDDRHQRLAQDVTVQARGIAWH